MLEDVLQILPSRLSHAFSRVSAQHIDDIREIYLRTDGKLYCNCGGRLLFISSDGRLNTESGISVFAEDISDCVYKACEYSVYSHEQDLARGFLTIRGGHRIGLCGTAVCTEGTVSTVKDITALNIRIATERHGCADRIFPFCSADAENVLILSRPAAGKTTILRELARLFSCSGQKVCIIDERGELAAMRDGTSPFDLGYFSNVFDRYPKAEGITIATRTMSPDIIIADEIGTENEAQALLNCVHCGVKVIASAHADSPEDAVHRAYINQLLNAKIFTRLIFLAAAPPGTVKHMIKIKDGQYETACDCSDFNNSFSNRNLQGACAEKTSVTTAGDSECRFGIPS